jgi:hypothetical protein
MVAQCREKIEAKKEQEFPRGWCNCCVLKGGHSGPHKTGEGWAFNNGKYLRMTKKPSKE